MIKYNARQIKELDKYYKHPNNLVDLFEDTVIQWGGRNAIGTKNTLTKTYIWVTYRDIAERVDNLRSALSALKLKKGDFVGRHHQQLRRVVCHRAGGPGTGGRVCARCTKRNS